MRFSAKGLSLHVDAFPSQRELRQALSRLSDAATLQLGDETGQFLLLHARRGSVSLAVGLCLEAESWPQVHLTDGERILLGFGSQLVQLLVAEGRVLWQAFLGAPFRELIELEELDRLLVIHDQGAVCLSPEGEELWRHDRDLVEQYAIKRESLILRFAKAPGVRLDLLTGERR
ncbi:MAG: hypothetical protein ACOY93_00705 [Bacillota bacterium]